MYEWGSHYGESVKNSSAQGPSGESIVPSLYSSLFCSHSSHSTLNSISSGISVYSTCSLQALCFTCVGVCVRLCDLIICIIVDAMGMSEPYLNRA